MKITYTKKGKEHVKKNVKKFTLTLDNGVRIEMWSHGKGLQMRSMNDGHSHLNFKPIFPWSVVVDCTPVLPEEVEAAKKVQSQDEFFFPKRRTRTRRT